MLWYLKSKLAHFSVIYIWTSLITSGKSTYHTFTHTLCSLTDLRDLVLYVAVKSAKGRRQESEWRLTRQVRVWCGGEVTWHRLTEGLHMTVSWGNWFQAGRRPPPWSRDYIKSDESRGAETTTKGMTYHIRLITSPNVFSNTFLVSLMALLLSSSEKCDI